MLVRKRLPGSPISDLRMGDHIMWEDRERRVVDIVPTNGDTYTLDLGDAVYLVPRSVMVDAVRPLGHYGSELQLVKWLSSEERAHRRSHAIRRATFAVAALTQLVPRLARDKRRSKAHG